MSRHPVEGTNEHSSRRRAASRHLSQLLAAGVTSAALVAGAAAGVVSARPAPAPLPGTCPGLWAVGVQGTGESAPDAAPTTDTGMLAEVFRPLLAQAASAKVSVARSYVPYDADFGGFTFSSGDTPYAQSVQSGLASLNTTVSRIAATCPDTRIALAGYSQGAHVVSLFAQAVGQGRGAIGADRIAAVALFGDPTRHSDSGMFPGDPGRIAPDRVPDTSGTAVSGVEPLTGAATQGGGIGPERDVTDDFGSLTGRVADFCISGDLACAAPDHAPILRVVANIAGQAQYHGDPLAALSSVTQALAFTGIKAATNVVNNDISGDSLATLDINPQMSLSERVAQASDPRVPVDAAGVIKALFKVGTIALNSVLTVVQTVLSPANIGEIATAGLSNPIAGLAVFGEKLLSALPELVPPETGSRLIQETFQSVLQNVTDNRDLLNTATWAHYSDVIARHGSYASDRIAGGKAPTAYAADWFTAAARDIGKTTSGNSEPPSIDLSVAPTAASGPNTPTTAMPTPTTTADSGLGDLPLPGASTNTSPTTGSPAATSPATTSTAPN